MNVKRFLYQVQQNLPKHEGIMSESDTQFTENGAVKQRIVEPHAPCAKNFSQMRAREPLSIPLRGARTPSMQRNLFLAPQKIFARNGSLKSLGSRFFAGKAKVRRKAAWK